MLQICTYFFLSPFFRNVLICNCSYIFGNHFIIPIIILNIAPKHLCSFTDKLQNEFPFIKKVKSNNNFEVQCSVCFSTFSVSHGLNHNFYLKISTQTFKNIC